MTWDARGRAAIAAIGKKQTDDERLKGYLGISDGAGGWVFDMPYRAGKTYIRLVRGLEGEIAECVNLGVPNDPTLLVYPVLESGVLVVRGADANSAVNAYGQQAGAAGNVGQPESGTSGLVTGTMFTPLQLRPSPLGGLRVVLDAYPAAGYDVAQTLSVSSFVPTNAGERVWVRGYVDSAGAPGFAASPPALVPDNSLMSLSDARAIALPAGATGSDAFTLAYGQTEISLSRFVDLRAHHAPEPSTSSSLPSYGAQETVAIAGGVLDISGATWRNIVVAAESGTADTVDSIVGLDDGEAALFQPDAGDTITFAHDSGVLNLYNGANLALSGSDLLMLVGRGAGEVTQPVDEKGSGGSGGGGYDYACIQDQKSSGTNGGTFTNGGWRTRQLNTIVNDPAGFVSLSSNQITLPAGTYEIDGSAPAWGVLNHQAKLYDVTNAADVLLGTVELPQQQTRSFIQGQFTLSGTTTLEIQHRCNTTQNTFGFGVAATWGTEIYTTVVLRKLA